MPRPSSAESGPRLSSTATSTRGMATRPIGTLIQNTHSQARWWTTVPPNSGPTITASPEMPSSVPMAAPRRSGGNAADTIVSPSGRISAAPVPWTTRAAISAPTVPDSAAAADPPTNTARPAANMRRRPNRSPSAAPVMSSTAKLKL